MCGIAGFVKLNSSTISDRAVRHVAFKLLQQIAERGDKATGYAFADREDGLKVVKDKVGVQEFIKRYGQEIKRDVGKAQAWIAHSRLPTTGSVEQSANNHPLFTKKGLAIVHNGIVSNADEIYKHFGLERDGKVDSEVILKLIEHQRTATTHIDEAITQAVKYLDGNLTFALIDEAKPSEVWIHKWGYSAPMSVVVVNGLVVFASELGYALSAIGKRKKDFIKFPPCEARTLKDGELLHITAQGLRFSLTDPESEAIRCDKIFTMSDWQDGYFKAGGVGERAGELVKGDPDDDEAFRICPKCLENVFEDVYDNDKGRWVKVCASCGEIVEAEVRSYDPPT